MEGLEVGPKGEKQRKKEGFGTVTSPGVQMGLKYLLKHIVNKAYLRLLEGFVPPSKFFECTHVYVNNRVMKTKRAAVKATLSQ